MDGALVMLSDLLSVIYITGKLSVICATESRHMLSTRSSDGFLLLSVVLYNLNYWTGLL